MIRSLAPAAGPSDGGTSVTISGSGFTGTGQVLFGGVPATSVDVVSDGELRAVSPPGPSARAVTVRVVGPAGTSDGGSSTRFEYVDPPSPTGLSPAGGTTAGGTVVTIEGAGFTGVREVTFDGTPATVLTLADERVRVASPPRSEPGEVQVRVFGPGGPSGALPFTYAVAPTVTGLSPASGSTRGGEVVTVRGTYLGGATEVTFAGVPGTDLVVVSDAELSVTAPPSTTARRVDVLVTTPAGTSEAVAAASFTYRTAAAPALQPDRTLIPLGLIGLLSWSVWFVRRFLSRHRYRPVVNDFRTTTSVVVPVYREDADVLERCLRTWVAEDPTEVVLVVDDRDEEVLRRLADLTPMLPSVRVIEWRHTGKRGALGAGVRAATGDVVVFADSDTAWRPGLLAAIQMPFADPSVGGVGSRQHVYLPRSHVLRRAAYWMLNSRYLDYVPAMSRRGAVACLSGRTAAYRRAAILPLLPALEHEVFLGRECVAGDDGRLTWLVLAAGYRTVHQHTAQADSMFPGELRAFVRQRVRWSRNSYRCYLTAVAQGWLWRQPFITQVTVLQILLTPVSMGAAVWYGAQWVARGGWVAAAIVVAWAVVGRAIRATSHLREHPRDLSLAPLMALVVAGIALPVKFVAAVSMNKQGWLTRHEGERVEGQGEIEVVPSASAR